MKKNILFAIILISSIFSYFLKSDTIKNKITYTPTKIEISNKKELLNSLLSYKNIKQNYYKQTYEFYKNNQFKPLWSQYLKNNTKELENLLFDFKNKSIYLGLDPLYYNYYEIIKDLNEYKNSKSEKEKIEARLDVNLSLFYINVYNDMLYGRTDPMKIIPNLYEYDLKSIDFTYPLKISNKTKLFSFIEFNNPNLNLLYKELILKPYEKDKIIANIEFYKWDNRILHTKELGITFNVNLAECYLYISKNDNIINRFKVCIGKNSITEKGDTRSPLLSSSIYQVIINPMWFVPKSIFINEVFEKTYKDTAFWNRVHMVMVDTNGKRIKLKDFKYKLEDLKKMPTLPFTTFQLPYDGNSLGKYKFIFNNKHGIYMHDTDEKELFAEAYRCYSHGCIRVENPNIIFETLRKEGIISINQQNYNNILKNKQTSAIQLIKSTPFKTDYKTITFHNNFIEYHQDIYGIEKMVIKKMNN